jgi:hypothetical protein
MTKRKARTPASESPANDLQWRDEALQRTDELLRAMLASPPHPHTPKPKKRAKK